MEKEAIRRRWSSDMLCNLKY